MKPCFLHSAFGRVCRTIGQIPFRLLLSSALVLAGLIDQSSAAEPVANPPTTSLRLLPPVFSGNELWLGVEGGEPDGIYDLFWTTNLSADLEWRWQVRSAVPGQTSFVISNGLLTAGCLFQLGTMLDSDEEGLTDAFEHLVTRTDAGRWDTEQDGVSDYVEFLQGRNPLVGAVPDSQGVVNLRVFTPLQ